MTSPTAPPVWQQAQAVQERLIAAAEEFHRVLLVPLNHPDTGEELLPRTPLATVIELSRIAIRRVHNNPQPILDRLEAAVEELYTAIHAAAQPPVGEGVTTYPLVALKGSSRGDGMAELTGLKVFTIRQIVAEMRNA
ncbi:hypothetical protein [Streptosporangium sp. NBC_01756]|uniref:hypothetical protein n=1 Tax=Streptosporangium sp. NBC_01756 TaxID=2975950 RepID=UPI002DDBFFEE|nr:hypothetical protein [Streptosporangium sp. NBC_01756]WSC85640.1 hypothetical protein OIE48_35595 [Streptosporangium sp. NBC_01756]